MSDLLAAFTLIAVVLTISALASGLVERTPVSFPMIFLGIGFLLGQGGVGVLDIGPQSEALEIVAVLSLAFVLFLDAVNLRFNELGEDWLVPALSLGPGTLLTVVLVATASLVLLKTSLLASLMLGAILSSIDPVVLRDVVRDARIPRSVRRALQIEAGTNDIVVLPIVLVLLTVAGGGSGSVEDWLLRFGRLFILGPISGLAVGIVAITLIRAVRSVTTISREYRALYGVGAILAAYAMGEWVGSSGFLAVFASGAIIVWLDYDLCECFLEYSEITAEMTMLLAFILFGALLSTMIGSVVKPPSLVLAVLVIAIARPIAIGLVLSRARISTRARAFIGWFGPRGLSSLLFALLVARSGVLDSHQILGVVGLVVIISVVVHGVTVAPLASSYERAMGRETLAEEREGTAGGLFEHAPAEVPRITPEELADRLAGPEPPVVLDVRSRSSYERDRVRIPGSVRVPPDQVMEWANSQPREHSVVTYCT